MTERNSDPGYRAAPDPVTQDTAMTISKEVLTVGTEWIEAGRIRLRRHVVTETKTVQVTVRREELQIQVHNIDQDHGVLTGSDKHGPVTDPPQQRAPVVIVLQEEVPVVNVRRQPYERVTVEVDLVSRAGRVTTGLRHEELTLDTTRNTPTHGTTRDGDRHE